MITRRILERVAENRIQEAMRAGEFDGLPGAGRPLPDVDEPYDPLWWVRRCLRRERIRSGLLATLGHGAGRARALLLRELR